ncbi:ferritin-like domain-containing protein [Pseudohalioglobus lutimaris]|uniref:Rubrerythrin n=1 Tax=Pseudohalioglobus lutimaris TaxID=1737061 RepID=A0A2N5WZN1_9GAMM|nr:ferritin family protein [Pseudohalioglobus lutimaris]PLW67699.1 rubrerythrin [Pseudohalioglobus lutimaris]
MSTQPLADFLAHSVELESEARERYLELAESMAAHHNDAVSEFFLRMAEESRLHLEEVGGIAKDHDLPELKAWEFQWPDEESPETTSYEAVHYRMSLREAMLLALDNERAAEKFYASFARSSSDENTRKLAAQFAAEEASHAAQLVKKLGALPADSGQHLEEDDDPHMPE